MILKDHQMDVDLYDLDPITYEKMMNNIHEITRKHKAKFMGPEFMEPYKLTREELEDQIRRTTYRYNHMLEQDISDILIEKERDNLERLLMELKIGNYILTEAEEKYREKWLEKENEFYTKHL